MLDKEYTKIHSLWKREGYDCKETGKKPNGKQFIAGEYALEEFGNIKRWSVEEKVDGTNVRVIYHDGKVSFGGRTKDAQMPPHLLKYLQDTLGDWNLCKVFVAKENEPYPSVILFGEGYGPKIQAAGENYSKEVGFILFDILVGHWWLKREDVKLIAENLNIPMVPQIGIMHEKEIVEFVKSKPLSRCSVIPQMMEGVVCRSEPLVLGRNGQPILFKLKCRDL